MTLADSNHSQLKRHQRFHLSESQAVRIPHHLLMEWLGMADQMELQLKKEERPTLCQRFSQVLPFGTKK